MIVQNFMSQAFSYQDLRRGGEGGGGTIWGIIREKYPGADRVNTVNLIPNNQLNSDILRLFRKGVT